MTWVESNGIWSAEAAGLKFELIPGGADLVFGLAHMKETCLHLARMQAAGFGGWAKGSTVKMGYRSDSEPVAGIRKTKGGYQRGGG
jgi:hypothetical protein